MTMIRSRRPVARDGADGPMLRAPRLRRTALAVGGLATAAGLVVLATTTLSATLALDGQPGGALSGSPIASADRLVPIDGSGAATASDGHIALDAPVSITDLQLPAIAQLDPELREAATQADDAAASEGVEILITGGWRSEAYQQHLLDDAIARYGSVDEARRWVNTPEGSTHVTGDAIDVGRLDAMRWMQQHGERFGLCQIYDNEPWHYELAAGPDGACPALLHDSR